MTKSERAAFVWQTLFVESTPLSEAARGIITVLKAFNLDTRALNVDEAPAFFTSQNPASHVDRILEMARVSELVMTNDPFSEHETEAWLEGIVTDDRFHASLRLDALLNDWPATVEILKAQDFEVDSNLN